MVAVIVLIPDYLLAMIGSSVICKGGRRQPWLCWSLPRELYCMAMMGTAVSCEGEKW